MPTIKPFFKLLREINLTFGNIIFFSNFLVAVIIFLATYLLLSLIKLPGLIAIIPALLFFGIDSYLRIKKKHYREVESAYPALNEKLRTAADNLYMENPFVNELQREVISDAKHVRVSHFVNQRDTSYKMLACVILCFGILFVSTFNIGFDIKLLVDRPRVYKYMEGTNQTGTLAGGDVRSAGGGTGDDIYGEPEVAELGQELFDFSISASGFEINLDDIKEVEKEDFQELFPESVFTTSSAVYEENIPKKQLELVKNYFSEIK